MNTTSRSRYALKIMMDIALYAPEADKLGRRQDISMRQGVPAKYLDQILALLRRGGLIVSVRGRDGGYFLARPASQISIWDIFNAVETAIYPVLCVGELNTCIHETTCMTADPWRMIFDAMKEKLQDMNLADITQQCLTQPRTLPAAAVQECQHGKSDRDSLSLGVKTGDKSC